MTTSAHTCAKTAGQNFSLINLKSLSLRLLYLRDHLTYSYLQALLQGLTTVYERLKAQFTNMQKIYCAKCTCMNTLGRATVLSTVLVRTGKVTCTVPVRVGWYWFTMVAVRAIQRGFFTKLAFFMVFFHVFSCRVSSTSRNVKNIPLIRNLHFYLHFFTFLLACFFQGHITEKLDSILIR